MCQISGAQGPPQFLKKRSENAGANEVSFRWVSCSVDFGREAPKFRFEFCRGFFGGFSYIFQGKRPEKIHQKIPRKIHPGLCSEKIPLGFLQKPFLENLFQVGSHQFWESLREFLREFWFSYCSSRGMPCREWNFAFREWNFEFRELLREYPGTLPELREWPFCSESVFPEIGMVPRLLKIFQNSTLETVFRPFPN